MTSEEKANIYIAYECRKNMKTWSDRLGSDEIEELDFIISTLDKVLITKPT